MKARPSNNTRTRASFSKICFRGKDFPPPNQQVCKIWIVFIFRSWSKILVRGSLCPGFPDFLDRGTKFHVMHEALFGKFSDRFSSRCHFFSSFFLNYVKPAINLTKLWIKLRIENKPVRKLQITWFAGFPQKLDISNGLIKVSIYKKVINGYLKKNKTC